MSLGAQAGGAVDVDVVLVVDVVDVVLVVDVVDVVLVVLGATATQQLGMPAQVQLPRMGAAYPRPPAGQIMDERFSTWSVVAVAPEALTRRAAPVAPGAMSATAWAMVSEHSPWAQLDRASVE